MKPFPSTRNSLVCMTTLALIPLMAVSGAKVGGGELKDPIIDLKAVPQMRPAKVRAEYLERTNVEGYFRSAGFRPIYFDRIPMKLRSWENGLTRTLTDGGVPLSTYGREAVRESAALWAYYDPKSNLDLIRPEILALPKDERGPWLARRLYEVANRSLQETCGFRQPSRQLRAVNFANFAAHWVKRWGYYDEAKGERYEEREKRWIELDDFIKDPALTCASASVVYKLIVSEALRQHPEEFGDFKVYCVRGFWYKKGTFKVPSHRFNCIEIDGKYQQIFDATPYELQTRNRSDIWRRGNDMSFMGAFDSISGAILSVQYMTMYYGDPKTTAGQRALAFSSQFPGHDHQGICDLGNAERQVSERGYTPGGTIMYKPWWDYVKTNDAKIVELIRLSREIFNN